MKFKIFITVLSVLFLTNACRKTEKRSLPEVEKTELAKGIRNDSIFLGMHFGMSRKDFFAKCWDMNKKGVFLEGLGNSTVAFQLNKGELEYPAQMDFYPKFVDEKISEMPVRFAYKGWAPWNEKLQSNKLLGDVTKLMSRWYGKGFFVSDIPGGGKGMVKVDGNRRIIITILDEKDVLVTLSDLTALQQNNVL